MKSKFDCTIVILSYNSLKVTDTCMTKVEAAVSESNKVLKNNIKVVVVDNGSKDGSPAMIAKKHRAIKLIALKENIGYAAGNNLAMKSATTPYILLMNSDTYIEKGSLVKTFNAMEKYDSDVLVSRWVTSDGAFSGYGGYLPTPAKIILWSFGLESLPVIKYFLHRIYSRNPEFYKKPGRMEWCPPCFFLLKRKVYDLTRGFDDRLWFHMVDVEWCHRIRQKRFSIFYTPEIQVVHLGGASSKGLKNSLIKDNFAGLIHFCRIHYSDSAARVLFFIRLGLNLRSMLFFVLGKRELAATYNNISKELQA